MSTEDDFSLLGADLIDDIAEEVDAAQVTKSGKDLATQIQQAKQAATNSDGQLDKQTLHNILSQENKLKVLTPGWYLHTDVHIDSILAQQAETETAKTKMSDSFGSSAAYLLAREYRQVLIDRGAYYYCAKQYQAAVDTMLPLLQLKETEQRLGDEQLVILYDQLSRAYYRLQKYQLAAEYTLLCLPKRDAHPQSLQLLLECYQHLNQPAECLRYGLAAILHNIFHLPSWFALAEALYHLGHQVDPSHHPKCGPLTASQLYHGLAAHMYQRCADMIISAESGYSDHSTVHLYTSAYVKKIEPTLRSRSQELRTCFDLLVASRAELESPRPSAASSTSASSSSSDDAASAAQPDLPFPEWSQNYLLFFLPLLFEPVVDLARVCSRLLTDVRHGKLNTMDEFFISRLRTSPSHGRDAASSAASSSTSSASSASAHTPPAALLDHSVESSIIHPYALLSLVLGYASVCTWLTGKDIPIAQEEEAFDARVM